MTAVSNCCNWYIDNVSCICYFSAFTTNPVKASHFAVLD